MPALLSALKKLENALYPPPLSTLAPIIGIVDDDTDVRVALDSLLRSAGLITQSFATAEELLAWGRLGTIGLIVSDLNMPGMSGLDLQEELSRRSWRGKLVIITGCPTTADREKAISRGARAFFAKPVDPDRLLDTIGMF